MDKLIMTFKIYVNQADMSSVEDPSGAVFYFE